MIAPIQEDFLNLKLLLRLKKEIENEQLQKTIDEIDYFNKTQQDSISKRKFVAKEKIDLIKKLSNARIKNL